MKKTFLIIIVIVIVFIGVKSIFLSTEKEFNDMSIEEKVNYLMENMTIDEKISQMLVLYYNSDVVDSSLIEILNKRPPGGFILVKENLTTFEKTKKFVDDLKSNSEIPLIVSIDQEGGSVQRLQNLDDVTPTYIPYARYLGDTNDESLAYDVGKIMAEELRTLGINVTYAPVVDIFSNTENTVIGKRSFGSSSELVSKMANKLAKGLEENGIIATYKHFPGHGDTSVDSHYDLPIINKNLEELKGLELIPFKEAIKNDAKMIMIGHIALPQITGDETPASLSKKLITDILINEMGYKGLVITDALNMGAIKDLYTTEEIYTKAIEAGCDLLLMPGGSKQAIEYIKKNIDEKRIDESVKKILLFKYKYLDKDNTLDKSYLGSSSHKEIIKKIPIND